MRVPEKYTNPKLVDKYAQNLQEALEGLSWLEYSFPAVKEGHTEEGETYPLVYRNDGSDDNWMVLPDDSTKSFSLIEITDKVVMDEDPLETDHYYRLIIPMAVIVWGRLDYLYPNMTEDMTGSMVEDVVKKIQSLEDDLSAEVWNVSEISITLNSSEAFKDYSMLLETIKASQASMRTNTAFRIDFTLTTDTICLA